MGTSSNRNDFSLKRNYFILNPPKVGAAPLGYKYVYVLMFNVEGLEKVVPFYVGQTDNLAHRFGNHQRIMWHFAKFENPVKIWVAGLVPVSTINQAEQDLIHLLVKTGYRLTNSQVTTKVSHGRQKANNLELIKKDEIVRYLEDVSIQNKVLQGWKQRWTTTSASLIKNNIVTANVDVLKRALEEVLSSADGRGEQSRRILKIVADNYDFVLGMVPYESIHLSMDEKELKKGLNALPKVLYIKGGRKTLPNKSVHLMPNIVALVRKRAIDIDREALRDLNGKIVAPIWRDGYSRRSRS